MIGKIAHYGFDALLLSAVFAGVKQSTNYGCASLLLAVFCLSICLTNEHYA